MLARWIPAAVAAALAVSACTSDDTSDTTTDTGSGTGTGTDSGTGTDTGSGTGTGTGTGSGTGTGTTSCDPTGTWTVTPDAGGAAATGACSMFAAPATIVIGQTAGVWAASQVLRQGSAPYTTVAVDEATCTVTMTIALDYPGMGAVAETRTLVVTGSTATGTVSSTFTATDPANSCTYTNTVTATK